MVIKKLHEKEIYIDHDLAKNLVTNQFPEFASLKIVPIEHQGTDNIMFWLGKDKIIRMPRTRQSAASAATI